MTRLVRPGLPRPRTHARRGAGHGVALTLAAAAAAGAAVLAPAAFARPPDGAAGPGLRAVRTSLVQFVKAGPLLHRSVVAQSGAQRREAVEEAGAEAVEARARARERAAAEARARARARAEAVVGAGGQEGGSAQRAFRSKGRPQIAVVRPAAGWTTPVAGAVLSAHYGQVGGWSSGYHTGVDFAVPTGTSVRAAGAGTVVTAAYEGAYGNNVVIRHRDGRYTQYAHMSSLGVSPGQPVSGGQGIGLSGSTGNSTGPHLHFEARTAPGYGSDIDPLAYLRSHGVVI